jgi:hypothetical protein
MNLSWLLDYHILNFTVNKIIAGRAKYIGLLATFFPKKNKNEFYLFFMSYFKKSGKSRLTDIFH